MNPFRNKRPHEELTDPKNRRVNATLNQRAIRKIALYESKLHFVKSLIEHVAADPTKEAPDIAHPSEGLIETFLELSPAQGGEHRKDLVEALKGQAPPQVGFSVPVAQAPPPDKKKGGGL